MTKYEYDYFEPVKENAIIIDWAAGNTCNFQCSYCDPACWDGGVPWHDFDNCIRFIDFVWENICVPQNKIMFFNFHGGEPALWPEVTKVCEYIKNINENNIIRLLTNGTRSTKWWTDKAHLFDLLIVSIHEGQTKKEKIVEKFNQVQKSGINISLHVMMDIAQFDGCVDTYKYLYDNLIPDVSLQYKPVRISIRKHELQPYTDIQLATMNSLQRLNGSPNLKNQSQMQWRKDGEEPVRVKSIENEILLPQLNDWKDWYCNMGIETLVVQHNGWIKPGSQCFKNLKYGNISDKEYSIPLLPVKCKWDLCGCLTDLQTTKIKNIKKGDKYIDADISTGAYTITTRD
jgi:sulfatase maturation enzyme AslB (radical SAM superfamily)